MTSERGRQVVGNIEEFSKKLTLTETKYRCVSSKDGNIGFDRYIGTWILRIYR